MFSWGNKQAPINGPGDQDPPDPPDPPRDDDESGTDPDGDRDPPEDDRDEDSDVDELRAMMAGNEASGDTCELVALSMTIARLLENSATRYWSKDAEGSRQSFAKAGQTAKRFVETCQSLRDKLEVEHKHMSAFEGYREPLGAVTRHDVSFMGALQMDESRFRPLEERLDALATQGSMADATKRELDLVAMAHERGQALLDQLQATRGTIESGRFFDLMIGQSRPNTTDDRLNAVISTSLDLFHLRNEAAVLSWRKFRPKT
jgi:hypothetical protein